MALLFLSFIILTIIIPTIYGVQCTRWDKNANNTVPRATIDTIVDNLREYIPVIPEDDDVFDIKTATEDFNRGLKNEDIHWNITQLIKHNGYPVEEHEVTTSDGYVLSIYRIPGNGSVVFVMHELFGSSYDFITSGKERALALLLAAEGYDVWLGNARGNVLSRRNINLSPDCKEFWAFSWDEIGRIDIPTMIDYVLEQTNQEKIPYIGYSQGTTSFFVMCSERPEYNEKISIMISLATAAWMHHTTNILFHATALFIQLIPDDTSVFENLFGYEILPRNVLTNALTDIACGSPATAQIFCNNIFSLAFGFDLAQVNTTYLPRMFAHLPAGISARQLLHYSQSLLSKKFRRYDHGKLENFKRYGSIDPPDYPVEKVTTRVVIFQGLNDNSATVEDVQILMDKLPNFNKTNDLYIVPFEKFSHLDFILANDLKPLVHDKVLELLKDY